jgi:peptide/nickel transport system substrate-binding protein
MNRAVRRSAASLLLLFAVLPAGCRRADDWLRLDGRSELRIALPTGPLHLDPHLDAEEISNIFYHHLFDPLVFLDENLTVRPWLARSWSNPNPRTWLFTLHADAAFQDGRPVTAADVAFSMERIRQLGQSPKQTLLSSVQSVRAVSPDTVEIVTHEPYAPLLGKLSQIMIVPADRYRNRSLADTKRSPFGSGPYRLVARRADREYLLEAVPNHWHFRRLFRRVRILVEPDDAARAELLAQGRVDLVLAPAPGRIPALRADGRFTVPISPGLRLVYLGLTFRERLADGRPNPFRDAAVRRAVSMALDRTRLTTGPLEHMGEPAVQVVSRSVFGYTPDATHPGHDPEQARALLRQARLPRGTALKLRYPRAKYFRVREVAEECARQLAGVGIRATPAGIDKMSYLQPEETARSDMFLASWIPLTGDASDIFEACFHSRGRDPNFGWYNIVGYSNPEIDRMIAGSTRTADRQQRLELLQQILVRAQADNVWIPLYFLKDSYAHRRELVWRPRLDRYVLGFEVAVRP